MADLIPPHGGLSAPVDLIVPANDAPYFRRAMPSNTALPVNDADLATLYRIADGGLSPLKGPMTRDVFARVLEEEVIVNDGRKYAWTIPVAFPVDADLAKKLGTGSTHPLKNEQGVVVGTIDVRDVYPWDKAKFNASVYGTTRADHPGARLALSDERTYLVGGEVRVLPQPKNKDYGDLMLSPLETRALFAKKGFERVVAFPTRHVLSRADEYALVAALERLTRDGHVAGAVLNPLVGETTADDVDAVTRMKTYRALIDSKAFGQGDTDDELWAKVGRSFSDSVLLLGLDIKMLQAGPKEAVMHAIYRQNFGFTDIVVGRDSAAARYDDGGEIWDALAAQRKFDELKGALKINAVKAAGAAYYAELGRVGLVDDHASKGWTPVTVGAAELREKLRAGELPDTGVMRPETAKVLIEKYRAG